MQATINRQQLSTAVSLAQGVVDSRNIRPILHDICFRLGESGLEVAATDMETGIRIYLTEGVEVQEGGAVALPADEISAILRDSPDETLSLALDGSGGSRVCQIAGADSHYRITSDDPEEFPPIMPMPDAEPLLVDAQVLAEMVKKTRFAAAEEVMRYALNGVLLVAKKGDKGIDMVGADGRRLALIRRRAAESAPSDVSAILSLKSVALLEKILADREGSVRITTTERQVWLDVGDVQLVAQLIEGHYPNYEEVIPDDCERRAVVDREAFLSAIRRASVVLVQEFNAVDLVFEPGTLKVLAETPERGSAEVTLQAKYEGSAASMRFCPDYLTDMLKVADDDEAVVEFKDVSRPAILRCGRNYQYVVMPIAPVQP